MQKGSSKNLNLKKKFNFGRFFAYVYLGILAFTFIFPYIWLIFSSFKEPYDIFSSNFSLLPRDENGNIYFSLLNYTNAIEYLNLGRVFLVTMFVATFNTLINLLLNSLAGYAFARIRFKGKGVLFALVLFTMMVPGTIMTIPTLIISDYLGIVDELPVLILPFIMSFYNVYLMRQQFLNVNQELEEAALMDGASQLKIFFTIAIPLVSPMLVVLGITTFMWNYNNFMWTLLATPSNYEVWTLARSLGNLISAGSNDPNMYPQMLAGSVITSLPLIIIFFVLQKYILEGINVGGVKE